MNLTTYAKNRYINVMRGTTVAAFVGYLGLSTTTPSDDGSGITEPVGDGYARQPITWNAPVDGVTAAEEIVFAASGGDWGLLTNGIIFDAISGGNAWAYDALLSAETVNDGDTLTILAGQFDLVVT